MRKRGIMAALLILWCLLGGCGKKEAATGYFEILSERQDFCDVSADIESRKSNFLGMQFYLGEPVQLWALADPNDREKADIYLYGPDGERECVMKGQTEDFLSQSSSGFLDRDGNLYGFSYLGRKFVVIKVDPSGKRLYRQEEDPTWNIPV